MGINYTPHTWGTEEATSSLMNSEIKALWDGLQAPWDSYTPTWGASGSAPSKGNGTITGSYFRIGKTVHYAIVLTIGSSTTLGTGVYNWSLPVSAARGTYFPVGTGIVFNSSGGTQTIRGAMLVSSTTLGLINEDGTRVDGSHPIPLDTSDTIQISGTYEAS